jgi:hypothetical protein
LTHEVHDAFTGTQDLDTVPKISDEDMKKLVGDVRILCERKGLPYPSDELLRSLLKKRNKHMKDLRRSQGGQQARGTVGFQFLGKGKLVFRRFRPMKLLSKREKYKQRDFLAAYEAHRIAEKKKPVRTNNALDIFKKAMQSPPRRK